MAKQPKVSLIISVYNAQKHLADCLQSALNQTLKEIEIICVNDGSTDNSLEILREYEKKDSRIIVIDKPYAGYGHSLNVGLDALNGEYICIFDSDNFADLIMCETLYELAKNNNVDFIKSDYYRYLPTKDSAHCKLISDKSLCNRVVTDLSEIEFDWALPAWGALYKTSFIRDNEIKNITPLDASYQDQLFFYLVLMNAKRAYFFDAPLYYYRTNYESSSSKNKKFCINKEYSAIEKYVRSHPDESNFYALLYYKKLAGYKWNFERFVNFNKPEVFLRGFFEYKKAYDDGVLDYSRSSVDVQKKIKSLLSNPVSYILKTTIFRKINAVRTTITDFGKHFKDLNAQSQIERLAKKYKNKKIVIYGAGQYCRYLFENYDLSKLNICAIADKAFINENNKFFLGYECISPEELKEFDCDVVLLSVYNTLQVLDYLEEKVLFYCKNTHVEIRPIIEKTFPCVLREYFKK